MNKYFALCLILKDGKRAVLTADNSTDLIEQGRKIRDAGVFDGKPVQSGVVLSSVRGGVVTRFVCKPPQPVDGVKKPSKAK